MKKTILIILGIVVVLVVVALNLRPRDKAENVVEAGKVTRRDLTAVVNCSGTIQPKRKVDVSANAMGTIVNLAVVEGQQVQEGDLLLEIDPSEYEAVVLALQASIQTAQADLQLAEASLEKARRDHARTKELHKEGLASEEQLTAAMTTEKVEQARVLSAQHRIAQSEANLAKARHDLEKVTITAPMTGVITRLNVEQGENAIMGTLNNPGTVLLVISDLSTMEAWVDVDETEVVGLHGGQRAEVTIDAFPDSTFTGTVTEIDHSPLRVNTGGASEAVEFQVKVTLDDAPVGIRPGLTAKAEITVARRSDALAVPLGAVTVREWPLKNSDIRRYRGRRARKQARALDDLGFGARVQVADSTDRAGGEPKRKETEGVFVVHEGFVVFKPVTLGITGEDDFEVLDGVQEGQTVVSGPFRILRELKDGAMVTIQKKGERDKGRDRKSR